MFQYSNGYIKSHYSGMYLSKFKIDYNREEDGTNQVEMKHCRRVKSSVRNIYIIITMLLFLIFS